MALYSAVDLVGLAQTTPADPLEEFALGGGLLLFVLIVLLASYLANVFVTLLFGAPVVAFAADSLRNIDRHVADNPVRSGALGFGSLVGATVAYVVFALVVLLLIDVGLPEPTGIVLVLTGFGGMLLLSILVVVGEIIAGLVILKQFGSTDEPSLWVALGVAAIGINLVYLIPLVGSLVALVLVSVATGAIVDRWWQGRGGDVPPSSHVADSADD